MNTEKLLKQFKVAARQKGLSELNHFFTDVIEPQRMIEYLEELRTKYLELSLHVLFENENPKRKVRTFPHENVHQHSWVLSALISLIKNADQWTSSSTGSK